MFRAVHHLAPSAVLVGFWWWSLRLLVWEDHSLVDGDAAGHAGMVEDTWIALGEQGLWATLVDRWTVPHGEYPPLFSFLVAMGLPSWQGACRPDFQQIADQGALALVAAAVFAGVAAVVWRAGPGSGTVAAAVFVGSPLWAGLSRTTMPEPLAAILVVGAWWVSIAAGPGLGAAMVGGVLLGSALLVKQWAVLGLVGWALFAVVGWMRVREALIAALTGGALAAPWYLTQWEAQRSYLERAVAENPGGDGSWSAWTSYLFAIPQVFWAPASITAAICCLVVLRSGRPAIGTDGWRPQPEHSAGGRHVAEARAILAATLLVALALSLLPKKYDRLLLILVPGVAVSIGLAWGQLPRRALLAGAYVAAAVAWRSPRPAGPPWLAPFAATEWGLGAIDERCPQRWVGERLELPAEIRDLATVLDLADPDGHAAVGSPTWWSAPCEVETALGLDEWLRTTSRRSNTERTVLEAGQGGADLVVFTGMGQAVPLLCPGAPALCAGRGEPVRHWPAGELGSGGVRLWLGAW